MFIKRNRSRHGDSEYQSVLLVQGKRVPTPRKPGRPPKGEPKGEPKPSTVVHETLANLSKLPEPLIALIERYCKAERDGEPMDALLSTGDVHIGPVYGPLASLRTLAKNMGIERSLGPDRYGQIALFLVLARVIHQGSRLSAVRWAEDQAVRQALGIEPFQQDEIYRALSALEKRQTEIEAMLAPPTKSGTVFLYDVSSYLEGQKNELAAPGYNRDGKRFKKQIVFGLLTDAEGEAISIQVYSGNTSDPAAVADQVKKLKEQYKAKEVVLVGDRGMLRGPSRRLLGENGFRYVTALTKSEIRTRLSKGTLQLGMFDEQVAEVCEDGQRLLLRRNPEMVLWAQKKREDQYTTVRRKVGARNEAVAQKLRMKPETSLKQARRWLAVYGLGGWLRAELEDRTVKLVEDVQAREVEAELDGCYLVVSDVPAEAASAQQLRDRYGDLQKMQRDFRRLKTGLLELRPIYLRRAERARGHALVSLLALKLVRELERRLPPLGISVGEAMSRLSSVRLVSLADASLDLWRLPGSYHPPVRQVLDVLPPLPPPLLSPRKTD